MANSKATTIICGPNQVLDQATNTCISITPVFSMTSTVLQGPDCWPPRVEVPTDKLGLFVKSALAAAATREFEGLSGVKLQKKLKALKGRRTRMKKRMGAAKKKPRAK